MQLGSPSGVASGVNLNQNIPETPLMPATPVYHYTNSTTNEHVASLLPPDHPEMLCLQEGVHVPETKFGILGSHSFHSHALYGAEQCTNRIDAYQPSAHVGMLAAIFWFPLGIGICMLDRRVKCTRCGFVIDDGICK